MVDDVGAQMKADGLDAEQPDERSREHMLTRVLLHVIESTRPVHDSANSLPDTRHRSIDNVHNSATLIVDHVDHAGCAQRSGIERLTTCGGIKRRAIEAHAVADAVDASGHKPFNTDDGGVEFAFIRVVVVQAFCHQQVRCDRLAPAIEDRWTGRKLEARRRRWPRPMDF